MDLNRPNRVVRCGGPGQDCGTGRPFAEALVLMGRRVLGVDLSAGLLELGELLNLPAPAGGRDKRRCALLARKP